MKEASRSHQVLATWLCPLLAVLRRGYNTSCEGLAAVQRFNASARKLDSSIPQVKGKNPSGLLPPNTVEY